MDPCIKATSRHKQSKQNKLNFFRKSLVESLAMSSDLRKPKQSEKNARVFQITASVNSLKLECRKNVW